MLDSYSAVCAMLSRLALWLAGAGLVLMAAFVAWLVIGRYVLNDSPTWTEPAVLLLMSWFIILGAAVGVRERDHLGFEIGLATAPAPVALVMRAGTEILVGAFGVAMSVYGGQLAIGTWADSTPMIGLPKGLDYVPMVIGGALIAMFSAENFWRVLVARE
jgi:TRAP-type C4-dicarboxylate transport system permease small subunit